MSGRLADITARIEGVEQLGAVVNAMRGIAAARAQQARNKLGAVDSYSATIRAAMARTLALLPPQAARVQRAPLRTAIVAFGAEQGFAGAFSERVLDVLAEERPGELLLVGARAIMIAQERGVEAVWKASMPSHPSGVPRLADHISEALYARLETGRIDLLEAVYCTWQAGHGPQVARRRLFPILPDDIPPAAGSDAPLINLRPDALMVDLTGDYVHAQLCETALHSFAAESEARMEAMARARRQIEVRLDELRGLQRIVRQDEITAEIIELAAGETASRAGRVRNGG